MVTIFTIVPRFYHETNCKNIKYTKFNHLYFAIFESRVSSYEAKYVYIDGFDEKYLSAKWNHGDRFICTIIESKCGRITPIYLSDVMVGQIPNRVIDIERLLASVRKQLLASSPHQPRILHIQNTLLMQLTPHGNNCQHSYIMGNIIGKR